MAEELAQVRETGPYRPPIAQGTSLIALRASDTHDNIKKSDHKLYTQ